MKYEIPTSIGARWGARAESAEQVGHRIFDCIQRLEEVFPEAKPWGTWTNDNPPQFRPVKRWTLEAAIGLAESRSVVSELRHLNGTVDLLLQADVASAPCDNVCLKVFAGCTHPICGALYNSVHVNWTLHDVGAPPCATVAAMVEAIADAWEPDYCECFSLDWEPVRKMHRLSWNASVPRVGWMVYLANRRVTSMDVPSAFEIRPCGAQGSLVIVRNEPIRMQHKLDFALAERVRTELQLPLPYSVD